MTATVQAPVLDDDTRRLIDAVVRDLVTTQSGAGSRDLGPTMPGSGAAQPADQDAQRFFGGIVASILTTVVPKIAPTIFGMLQQRRRDLGLPEQRDAAATERDFQSILTALLPKLLDAVPVIANAISGQPAPRGAQEESQRFLPFLAALIPAVVSAVPSIIGAFNQQRGADATPPPITDPDVAQRFLGPLLASFVPQLVQAAPSILGSIFGGGSRAVAQPAW